MIVEDFEILHNETIEISISKQGFFEVYHHYGANSNNLDQNKEFIFGEKYSCHQKGKAYLQNEITIGKHHNTDFFDVDAKKLLNNAFAYHFKEGRLAITGGSDPEHKKKVVTVPANMRFLTSKDRDFSNCSDKSKEISNNDNTLKQLLINKHDIAANEGKMAN